MKLFKIGKWKFDIGFYNLFLPSYFIYKKGIKFILFDFSLTDFNGWITFCNIRLKWNKYFKKGERK